MRGDAGGSAASIAASSGSACAQPLLASLIRAGTSWAYLPKTVSSTRRQYASTTLGLFADNALVKAAPIIDALGRYAPPQVLIPEVRRFLTVLLPDESLVMLLRLRDIADQIAYRHASALQIVDVSLTSRIGSTLEHVPVQLIDDPSGVGGARLLSLGGR